MSVLAKASDTWTGWAAAFFLAAAFPPGVAYSQASRPIDAADLLRFATVGDPLSLEWFDNSDKAREASVGVLSPDGAKLAVVVRRGAPELEANVSTLLIFETAELRTSARPATIAEFAASSAYQPVAYVRWLADSETLAFAASEGDQLPQIYTANVRTGTITALIQEVSQLFWYDVSANGQRLVTLTAPAEVMIDENPKCRHHGCRITANLVFYAERTGSDPTGPVLTVYDLRTGRSTSLPDPVEGNAELATCDPLPWGSLSPNGRFVIRQCRVKPEHLLAWWSAYTMNPGLKNCGRLKNVRCWRRNVVTDLETGTLRPLNDAPSLPSFSTAEPIWIDNGRRIIIPAAYESTEGVEADERSRRIAAYAVQVLDAATGEITRIGRLSPQATTLKIADWNEQAGVLRIVAEDSKRNALPPQYFQRKNGEWRALAKAPAVSKGVKLVVEQTLNDAPMLTAVDSRTGARKTVLDPNPWLRDRHLGRVEAIEWKANAGKTWHGGIYYPPDYQAGRRYPILIQTHGFDKNLFSLHGYARNFPGQALAARGVMVVQVGEQRDSWSLPNSWDEARAGYEGLIDYLDGRGLIDRTRVGIVGWSATGNTTAAMLTHSDYPIAAAAFTESGVSGYWYNIANGTLQESRLGGLGLGAALESWLENGPTFNLNRMRTPLLQWSAKSVLAVWDFHVGLKAQGRPVETWRFGNGTHDLHQASQRLVGAQLLIDWFVFWLKDEERTRVVPWGGETEASLEEQYARWRHLRKQQDEVLGQPRPPLLDWTATPRRVAP